MTHMLRIPRPLTKVAILIDAYASLGKKEYLSHLSGNRLHRPLGTSLSTDLPSTRPPMRNVQSEKLTPGNPRRLLAKEASAQIIPNPRKHHQEASPHKLYRSSSVPLVHPSTKWKISDTRRLRWS